MKKALAIMLVAVGLTACNNNGNGTEEKVDLLNARKDTLTENVDSMAHAKIDSIKNRSEELKDKFDSSIDAKKDSIKNK